MTEGDDWDEGKTPPSEDNPDCPECGFEKTRIYTMIVDVWSYQCPECENVFKPR